MHISCPSLKILAFHFFFFFFFGHAESSLLPGFSLVVESGGYSLVGVQACCKEQTQEHLDFRSCGM